jgi:Secretin and TonB N terminus short domain
MRGVAAKTVTSINSSAMHGGGRTGLSKIARRHQARNRRRLTGVCAAALAIAAVCTAAAQERRAVASSRPMAVHIPAQSLVNALQAYGEQTGVQVLYESRSAAGQRSAAVEGTFTPEEALNLLLKGTELKVRYTRPDAITLELPHSEKELPPESPFTKPDLSLGTLRVRASSDDENDGLRDYSESVETDVQKALKKNAKTSTGSYRVVLDLWIASSRTIERAKLHQSTGDPDRDAAVAAAVRGVMISRPAPVNMPQPVRVAIVVRALQ